MNATAWALYSFLTLQLLAIPAALLIEHRITKPKGISDAST